MNGVLECFMKISTSHKQPKCQWIQFFTFLWFVFPFFYFKTCCWNAQFINSGWLDGRMVALSQSYTFHMHVFILMSFLSHFHCTFALSLLFKVFHCDNVEATEKVLQQNRFLVGSSLVQRFLFRVFVFIVFLTISCLF